ncbi:MAG: molybdopterin-dependent oxidoreductase [Burkholderiales bacterium]
MNDLTNPANSGTRTVLAACPHDCPDTCSMLVEVKDGKVAGVRGNPDHAFTDGTLCVKVNHYEERVHSKDRILYPLRRRGPKGSGEFVRMGWDEAIAEIGTRWRQIIDKFGPTAILPYSYLGTQGILNGLNAGDPFFNKLGATISERTFCDSGASTGYMMTVGPTPGVDPEAFVHSRYIILWACNTISTNLHHWPFIAEAQKRGAKVVVIDPISTRTARKADWHIRIRPGTDAALALGMMNVIVTENLTDRDYIDKYTVGYDELAQRASEYPPERVAEITGLPAADIRKLAREYASTKPSVIRIGVAIERHASGGQTVRALACLPALIGAWREVGGGILQLPIWAFPMRWDNLMRPDFIKPGTRVLNQWLLGQALTGELKLDPPIQSVMVYNSNPMVVAPEQDKLIRGFQREDLFTVVSEHFMTDTARYADIVLPATTQMEHFELMFSWGHFYVTANNQAIPAQGEAVPNTELFRRLAKEFGFDDPFFSRGDEQMAADSLDWSAPALQGITLDMLKEKGYARLKVGTPDTYAPHREGNFPTPSGKVELKASMAAGGNFVIPVFRQGSNEFQDGSPVDPLPHYTPPNESVATNAALGKRFPLNVMSPKNHAFLNSGYGNIARQMSQAGEQFVVIHPRDAESRGIREGALVEAFNDRGCFQAVAKVSDDVMPGVISAPLGYWMSHSKNGRTVSAVNSAKFADLGRAPTFSDQLVEVRVAG